MAKKHRIVGERFVVRGLFLEKGTLKTRVRDKLTGKVWKLSTGETTERKADQYVQNWVERQLKSQKKGSPTVILFEKAFEEWLGLKVLRASTRAEYRASFDGGELKAPKGEEPEALKALREKRQQRREENKAGVYKPAFGGKFVSEITLQDIEVFLKDLDSRRESGLSSRTKQKHLTVLRAFFRWAKRRRYTPEDPTEGIRVPRASKRTGIALTHEQARKLLDACRTPTSVRVKYENRLGTQQTVTPPDHLFLAVLIALHTGLRRGNITGMLWSHLDLGSKKISFSAREMKAAADHEVPIHDELMEVLEERLRGRDKVDPHSPVLGLSLKSLKKSFRWALRRAGLPYEGEKKIRFHDLRHTFATWTGSKATYAVWRALLGHSPGTMSEKYFHPPWEELHKVIDSMPRLLEPSGTGAQPQARVPGSRTQRA